MGRRKKRRGDTSEDVEKNRRGDTSEDTEKNRRAKFTPSQCPPSASPPPRVSFPRQSQR